MKNIIKKLTLICLVVLLAFSLVACSSYGKVQKALGNIGYTEIQANSTAENIEKESDVAITIHVLSNANSLTVAEMAKLNTVFVLEFKATEDMKTYYEDSATLRGLLADIQADGTAGEFYNKLVEKGLANGNCLVLSINPLVYEDETTAVKGA